MLITTDNLNNTLNDPNLVLIDARSYKEYSQGHIPGAVNLDLFAFHWADTSKQGISSFNQQTENLFSYAGIDFEKKVIFYDNSSGMLAARGVWLLMYYSHPNVLMLDGGLEQWKNDGLSLETKSNGFKPTKFSGNPNEKLIAGFEYIRDNIDKLKIIDARSQEEFDGTAIRAAQNGHIPNAINIDWIQNLNEDGKMKTNEELAKLYEVSKDSEIVTYCQGAYRAANSFLALKKLGFENVRVYLGSWGEWGNKLDLPVVK